MKFMNEQIKILIILEAILDGLFHKITYFFIKR